MRAGDRGESLLELLVAVAIMGVAVVAVLGGLATAVRMTDIHRKQATAGATVHAYAEAVQGRVVTSGYVPCASSVTYAAPAGFAAPVDYVASVVAGSMRYWSGTAWQGSCATDQGLQQLTLQVTSADGRVAEQLVITIRRPCRLTDAVCS